MAKGKIANNFANFKLRYKTEVSTDQKMSTKEIMSFGVSELGKNTPSILLSGYSKFFLMIVLGIDPVAIGVIFAVVTIIEGVRNPFIGIIVDCTKTKWGRFRPYVIIGAPLAALLSVLFFFNPFSGADKGATIWTYVTYLLYTTIATFANTGWSGLIKCITRDTDEKNRMFSLAKALNVISTTIPSFFPVMLDVASNQHWSLRTIFIVFSCLFAAIGFVGTAMARNLRERITIPHIENPFTNIKTVFKNKYVLIFWFNNIANIAMNLSTGIALYMFLYCYGGTSWQTIVWGISGIGAWLGLFFCTKLLRRFSPKALMVMNNLIMAVAMLFVYFVGYSSIWPFLAISLFAHILEYVTNVAQNIVDIDIMDYNEWKLGIRNEATIGTVGGLVGMVFSALNSVFLGFVLKQIGFVTGENVSQSESTIKSLFVIYSLGMVLASVLSILPWLFYDLSPKRMERIRKELKERKQKNTDEEKYNNIPIYF